MIWGIPKVVVYIDDVLVIGTTAEEHLKTLFLVLDRLDRALVMLQCSLSATQRNYSQIEREALALALVFGVQCFHFYVFGHHFKLVTDHQPLLATHLSLLVTLVFGPGETQYCPRFCGW